MLNVEMPRGDATPQEALVYIQDRIQRDRRTREAQQGSPTALKSSRLESASTTTSPSQKERSPAVKKKAPNKKSQQQKLLDSEDSEGEGKEVAEA